jgi:hypothetical protein
VEKMIEIRRRMEDQKMDDIEREFSPLGLHLSITFHQFKMVFGMEIQIANV